MRSDAESSSGGIRDRASRSGSLYCVLPRPQIVNPDREKGDRALLVGADGLIRLARGHGSLSISFSPSPPYQPRTEVLSFSFLPGLRAREVHGFGLLMLRHSG